jgi:hypothetical protein
MALNFGVLQTANPVNAFFQGQQDVAQNVMAQQKMAQEQEMNALRRQQTQLGIQQTRAEMASAEESRRKQSQLQKAGLFRERLLRASTPAAAREIVKMQYADPDLGQLLSQASTLDQALAEVPDDPTQFERFRQQEALGMTRWMESQLPKTVGNRVFDPRTMTYIEAPERPQVVAPSAPVAVIGPDGKPQYVSREQAIGMTPFSPATVKFIGGDAAGGGTRAAGGARPKAPSGYRYTPTGDLEAIPGGPAAAGPNLTPKDIQKREAALPQARQAVSTVSNTMSIIGETVDRLLANRDGLNGITGLIGGRTPGITDAARQAQADIDQLKNLAFIQGITELRNASKTGAGVGNVSNKEGDRFENLKASLERTQSYNSMVDALKRLKSQSEFTRQSLKEAFDETYAYRGQDAESPLTGGGGGGNLSPAEQAELDQLRKRFGKKP